MQIVGLLVIGGLLVAVLVLLAFLLLRRGPGRDVQGLMLLQNQLQGLTAAVDQKLGEGASRVSEGLDRQIKETNRLARELQELISTQLTNVAVGVAETRESTKQVLTIAEQLRNLERVLKHQKQRGHLGEQSLKLILDNVLPPDAFQMQYRFGNGETVDAAIRTKEGIIPIDAKFPLDNYQRLIDESDEARRAELERAFTHDLKLRIDETAKYVRPESGTLPFAFMFIPAEGIFYDLLVNEVGARNLIDYAYSSKNVIIVSPTTFAAYLQSVLYGFKAFKVEETAREIARNVESLAQHLKAYEDSFRRLGAALSTTVNHYNDASKELGKVDRDVLRITGKRAGLEPPSLDRPQPAE
jgi:DNA recombination protein RmuC